jgi:hypothetical protein
MNVWVVDESALNEAFAGHLAEAGWYADTAAFRGKHDTELSSFASNSRRAFNEVNLNILIREGKGSLEPGDTSTNDEGYWGHGIADRVDEFELRSPVNSGANQVLGFLGCFCPFSSVGPGNLLTKVSHLQEEGIQTRISETSAEHRLVEARTACPQDHAL